MITVVCFWWQHHGRGLVLPSQTVTKYDETWVYKLRNSVARNYSSPHRFVCITDYPEKLHGIETIKLWDDYRDLGGCFTRLKIFSSEMEQILGKRIIAIDLDCVIVGNIDHILDRKEDFVIHKYGSSKRDQRYNGSMFLMDAGAREVVWNTFGLHSPDVIKASNNIVGSDQAWIRLVLGPNEARFTESDGCYEIAHGLRKDASMIFFSGPRDPLTESLKHPWIADYWK